VAAGNVTPTALRSAHVEQIEKPQLGAGHGDGFVVRPRRREKNAPDHTVENGVERLELGNINLHTSQKLFMSKIVHLVKYWNRCGGVRAPGRLQIAG
jgi:hypothetical protein